MKIDEYLTSVRETEQRVQRLNQSSAKDDAAAAPPSQRPPAGQPKDFREYARLMCDIIALAFQTDRSRIATLLMSRDLSGQVYPFLSIRDDHHSYSHSNTGKEYQAIVKCHVEQYAYLIDRLAKMQEGEGTVLDNSCMMFVSEHWDAHNGNQVPLVLAGGLGGTLADRPLARLPQRRQRPAEAVQPVPVAHGPHGTEAAGVRRREGATGGNLRYATIRLPC